MTVYATGLSGGWSSYKFIVCCGPGCAEKEIILDNYFVDELKCYRVL